MDKAITEALFYKELIDSLSIIKKDLTEYLLKPDEQCISEIRSVIVALLQKTQPKLKPGSKNFLHSVMGELYYLACIGVMVSNDGEYENFQTCFDLLEKSQSFSYPRSDYVSNLLEEMLAEIAAKQMAGASMHVAFVADEKPESQIPLDEHLFRNRLHHIAKQFDASTPKELKTLALLLIEEYLQLDRTLVEQPRRQRPLGNSL